MHIIYQMHLHNLDATTCPQKVSAFNVMNPRCGGQSLKESACYPEQFAAHVAEQFGNMPVAWLCNPQHRLATQHICGVGFVKLLNLEQQPWSSAASTEFDIGFHNVIYISQRVVWQDMFETEIL